MDNLVKVGLYGEYRITTRSGDTVIADTGWCKNTILSSGLVTLYTSAIPDAINLLDLGTSDNFATTAESYVLSGVVTPSINKEFSNISRNNIEVFTFNLSSKVFYSTFSSFKSTSSVETIREFAIKTDRETGFARSVLLTAVEVQYGQNINFEYRLTTNWNSIQKTNVPFYTANDVTFYIPTTSVVYNIPYYRTFYTDNKLILLNNNEELPKFGDDYPTKLLYSFESRPESTFSPAIVSAVIDNTNRVFTVFTKYENLSSPIGSAIYSNINTALLVADGNIETPNKFLATRFKVPLTLYNYRDITDVLGLSAVYEPIYGCNKRNLISLVYRYSWGETLNGILGDIDKLITLPVFKFEDILYPCDVDYFGEYTTPINSFLLSANRSTKRIQISAGKTLGTTVLNYDLGPGATRLRLLCDGVEEVNTGFLGSDYYNNLLKDANYTSVLGAGSGSINFTRKTNNSDVYELYVDSPVVNSDWYLSILPPAGEFNNYASLFSVVTATTYNERYITRIPIARNINSFKLSCSAITTPDAFRVIWDGVEIVDTGYRGSSTLNYLLCGRADAITNFVAQSTLSATNFSNNTILSSLYTADITKDSTVSKEDFYTIVTAMPIASALNGVPTSYTLLSTISGTNFINCLKPSNPLLSAFRPVSADFIYLDSTTNLLSGVDFYQGVTISTGLFDTILSFMPTASALDKKVYVTQQFALTSFDYSLDTRQFFLTTYSVTGTGQVSVDFTRPVNSIAEYVDIAVDTPDVESAWRFILSSN